MAGQKFSAPAKGNAVSLRLVAALAAVALTGVLVAAPVSAEPDPDPQPQPAVAQDVPADAVPATDAVPPPVDDGRVESTPAAIKKAPDGWTLTVSAEDESQLPMSPLTTAISSREYEVGGTFMGALSGPAEDESPHGTLEVGYQIGCGIDMSTSNGVSLTGTVGLNSSLGILGTDVISPVPGGILPGVGGNVGGGITVGLKPGIINIVPVNKKEFTGATPWVMVSGFHIKIDGCVGQSFIRSYAILTRSTPQSDAVLAYYGVPKVV